MIGSDAYFNILLQQLFYYLGESKHRKIWFSVGFFFFNSGSAEIEIVCLVCLSVKRDLKIKALPFRSFCAA